MGYKGTILGLALVLGLAMGAWADDGFIGKWTVKQVSQGGDRESTLTIGEDSGTWESRRGVSQLSNIKTTDGKLTFTRTFSRQGEEFIIDCEATMVDGKLVGKMATQMGDREFTATRVAAERDAKVATDPSGTWRWEHEDLAGTGQVIPDILKIKVDGGKVSGTYVSPDGELPIENATLDGDTLHWELNIDAQGQILNIAWTGKISGDDVNGTVTLGDFGEGPWVAKRDSKVAVDPSGTWRWEHQDPGTGQTIKNVLKLQLAGGKVGGSYEMGGTLYEVNNSKLDGNTLSWDYDLEVEGQVINIEFSGDISGDALAGTVSVGDFGDFPWEAKRD